MVIESYSWGCLPVVVVYEILKYLNKSDRLQASSTCRHWRSSLWQPSFWRAINFRLLDNSKTGTECPRRLAQRCGNFVHEAIFEFNSASSQVVSEVRQILELLGPNVQKIVLKPSSCQIDWPIDDGCRVEDSVQLFVKSLEGVVGKSRNLRHLSLGCISEITDHANVLLRRICSKQLASRLEVLHIASIKEDPSSYTVATISPDVLSSFSGLRTLSIDYDHLTEEVIRGFIRNDETNLRQLIIHVHDREPSHAHISDSCWRHLASSGDVEVTLNLIHSTYGSANLLSLISPSMPLVHFRAFFCSHLNLQAVNLIGQIGNRLESFLVIDGMDNINEPNVYEDAGTVITDPFVMLAWKCPNLSSFTLIGYEINVNNVIAIARLRGNRLKKVVIPECCLLSSDQEMSPEDFYNEVSESLGHRWVPLPNESLHPAVTSEGADAETFYLDILQSDQDEQLDN